MSHERSIWEIMGWILFGITQKIRDIMPLDIIRPEQMAKTPPDWWYKFKRWEEWYYATDANGYPLSHWYGAYFDCVWRWLGFWVDEVGTWAKDTALNLVRLFTGYVQFGYTTFEHWVTAIRNRVGTFVPWFADSLADAVTKLYGWLPPEIRAGIRSWTELFGSIIDQVQQWAQDRYDGARAWYEGTRLTIEAWVGEIRSWWQTAAGWLDDFRYNAKARVLAWLGATWSWLEALWNDPFGVITGYLGETWTKIYSFARDCLTFWYNLWGQYGTEIGAFWGNPLRWLYDRVESFLVSIW